jgi:hypothetical protein
MYTNYVKTRPEHKFSVPVENTCWGEYKTFNTIGEAVFFISRLFGKDYKFVGVKDHPSNHSFTAEFEYINAEGETKIRRKSITIPNYDEVERKYCPVRNYRASTKSWNEMRALFGYGPYVVPAGSWVYNVD